MTLVKRNSNRSALPNLWDNFFNRDIFGWDSFITGEGQSLPAVNIKENKDAFVVEMAAPGKKKEDFKIELDGTALSISSEQRNESEEKDDNYSRREFSYQSFYRTFHLPKDVVDSEKINAKYEDGILKLEIPKREEAKEKPSRLIEVK
ncbi:MAG: Hsp20/alpha crystallin family protein [Chitinophagaceae bacterium]|nr:Hsp20/alpha crystallin family protein [Chitinophagaceae bacterium]MCZ2397202.1 Hsp20/alpha crystallin family protein [Chitinophagales bacterium]